MPKTRNQFPLCLQNSTEVETMIDSIGQPKDMERRVFIKGLGYVSLGLGSVCKLALYCSA
jgi:hypothetical protein